MIHQIWDADGFCFNCGMLRASGHKPDCFNKNRIEEQPDAFGTATPLALVTPENVPAEGAENRFPSIDWDRLYAQDFTQIDWLPGRFMEGGQQVALVGDGKVGKTLFVHDWLIRCVTGTPFLGSAYDRPLKVLYFDRENSERDVATRMKSLGAAPGDLRDNFDYRTFPKFSGSLDTTDIAVLELLRIVEESKPDIVILDTISRFIGGKENDSDTWLQLYQRIHVPLKRQGIACVRLDHPGKDTDRGSRGSSAKSQDVDHVWEMARSEARHEREGDIEVVVTDIRLKRTHTRTGLGEDTIQIIRRGRKSPTGMWLNGGTRHELMDAGVAQRLQQVLRAEVMEHVDKLTLMGVPAGLGRDGLRAWCAVRKYKLPGKNETVGEIVKAVKRFHDQRPTFGEDD